MKKYLKILFVFLFALPMISLTACGDDDDEPNGGGSNSKGVVGELTVNGTKTYYYYIQGDNEPDLHEYDYDALLWRKDGQTLSLQIYEDIFKFSKGQDLSFSVTVVAPYPYANGFFGGNGVVSGSITLTDIDSKYITLTFNNTVVKNYTGSSTITLDGTIKLPINGEMGSLKNIDGF